MESHGSIRPVGWLVGITIVFASVLVCVAAGEEQNGVTRADEKGVDFFEQRIRPVLVARCYECHSSDSKALKGGLRLDDREAMRTGGDSGPAIVPASSEESLLIDAIEYTGDFYDMPPAGKLGENVIEDFRRWIEMGAPDPRDPRPANDAHISTGAASRDDLWVLQPLQEHPSPQVKNEQWPRCEMDRFILAKLEESELAPAAPAGRYALLRRVTYDLTGLPPTLDEMESFLADRSQTAFAKVVDRLLDSPAFGDRWARHWLDLTSYADLADIQGNVVIRGAWRYRDYVINSFNEDKPWDQFIHEQIAGDLLPYESTEQQRAQMIATGYLSIGPWTLQNYVKEQLQADVVDHQIDKIGRTFFGMSVRCARCHDHKFDPIPTRDYYALAGIFHSTLTTRYDGPGVWSQLVTRPLPDLPGEQAIVEFDNVINEIKEQQRKLEAERQAIQQHATPLTFTEKIVSSSANAVTLQSGIAANQADTRYQVSFAAGPSVWADAAQGTREEDAILIQVLRADGTVLTHHVHRPGAWSGKADAQQLAAGTFAYMGDGSGDVTLHIIASPLHTGRFGGAIDDLTVVESATSRTIFSDDFDSYQARGNSGLQAATRLPVYAGGTFAGWTGSGVNHSHAVDLGGADGNRNIALQIFSGNPGSADNPEVAQIERKLGALRQRLRLLEYSRPGLTEALAVQDIKAPKDVAIYVRGSFRTPGEVVPRGFLSAISGAPFPPIPAGSSGRRELAEWLTSQHNPVTPRVLVNRIWHHVFGAGLVRSVDYFGIHGDQPSHPELLDNLAIRFVHRHQWSLKSLLRELILSSTYRMSSDHNLAAAKVDPDNRWLWRMNRRRLAAESIRDGMQAISGRLDYARGGPCLGLDIPGNVAGIGGDVNPPTYTGKKVPDHVVDRRVIYQPFPRSRPTGALEILSIFDFPHPNEITGKRPIKTVATQALFLMNAPFVKDRARETAQRLLEQWSHVGDDDETLVQTLYLLVVNRPADDLEARAAVEFVEQYQAARADEADPPRDLRLAAWTELCHALFASNDFLFKE